jgi:uncharacterized protein (TIGR03437 family)
VNFNPPGPTVPVTDYVQINNTASGILSYTFFTSYGYQQPRDWLTVTDPNPGLNHSALRLDANPVTLTGGTYNAMLTVNAGLAGSSTVAITIVVPPPGVTINNVVNAATFQPGPLVAGSVATIFGTSLSGNVVTAAFDGVPGTILFSSATQINVTVPPSISAKPSASLVVTVDGVAGAPFNVALASVAPGIFGTLNQDNSLNSATNPATAGEIIQIFATGLISATSSGYLVGMGNLSQTPLYQGSMPNGTQQVNVMVPQGLNPGPVTTKVCAVGTVPEQLICSPGTTLFAR